MRPQIVVLSCVEAEDFSCENRWACISIASRETEFIEIPCDRRRKGLLQIAFADIAQAFPGLILFDTDHAHDILDFVNLYWSKIDTLLVHCEAGLSRSPAVAAAISRLKLGRDQRFFQEPYVPNYLVYRTLLEVGASREDYQRDE